MWKYVFLMVLGLSACSHPANNPGAATDADDTLRVATLYSPTSFFIYRGDTLGIDYSMVRDFAAAENKQLKIEVARSLPELLGWLDSGRVALAAYQVPVTEEYKSRALACGLEMNDRQVLVQRRDSALTDVAELVGKDVWVVGGSRFDARMNELNQQLGGGIEIRRLDADSVAADDLIDMVADGRIPRAVMSAGLARLHGGYYANVDAGVAVSAEQRHAWAVAPGNKTLATKVDAWAQGQQSREHRAELLTRFYQLDKIEGSEQFGKIDLTTGCVSAAYDPIFRKWAPTIDWDWRLLAAQAYQESRFNPLARSFAGARGLMQIMPRTGRAYGLKNANSPEQSVQAAVKYLADLDEMFASKIADGNERRKFVLASYNAGQGHIFDAMRLAEKVGLDPSRWDDNVERAVLMLSNPKNYNDPVVRYGYLRGRETQQYVRSIMHVYSLARRAVPA